MPGENIITAWPYLLTTALGTLGTLVAHHRDSTLLLALCKPIASTGFVGLALASGALDSSAGQCVLLALICCWLGDVALIGRSSLPFVAGLFFFLLGHVFFALGFFALASPGSATAALALTLCAPAALVLRWLWPFVPAPMRAPVCLYVLAIAAMACLALSAVWHGATPLLGCGVVAFCISDIGVARDRFVAPSFTNQLWLLPLYYGGQTLLALSIGA